MAYFFFLGVMERNHPFANLIPLLEPLFEIYPIFIKDLRIKAHSREDRNRVLMRLKQNNFVLIAFNLSVRNIIYYII